MRARFLRFGVGFALAWSALAWGQPLNSALSYLQSRQGPDGAFGASTGEDLIVATTEALAALRAAGLGQSPEARNAELFLATAPFNTDSELVLRRARALAQSLFAFAPPGLTTHGPGFDEEDVLHMAAALEALRVPGQVSSPELQSVAARLSQKARSDGCFGFVENDDSPELTAAAILALRHFTFDGFVNSGYQQALACLKAAQRGDGSWGAPVDTASSLLALLQTANPTPAAIAAGRADLVARQQADGSWPGGVRATALAVQALSTSAPDWRITTNELGAGILVLSNPEPLPGETLVATVDVQNRSGSPAPETVVRYLARAQGGSGAEVVLGQVAVPQLAPGQQQTVLASLSVAQLNGRYTVRAVVNPDGAVPELDTGNNQASAPLNVRQLNDVAVSSSSIRFSDVGAGQGRIEVAVRNLGTALTTSVGVDVYKGSPLGGGIKLGSGVAPSGLGVNESANIAINWSTAGTNGPTPIYVVVDPANQLSEADENNNTAFRYYHPGANAEVDVSVSNGTATSSVPKPIVGVPFDVSFPVQNLGNNDANRLQVAIYQHSTGALLNQFEVPVVLANGTTTATARITLGPSSAVLRVVVDPQSLLQDTNRNNNTALISVSNVSDEKPNELEMVSFTGNSNRSPPGSSFTLDAIIKNNGTERANTFVRVVNLSEGNAQWAMVPVSISPSESKAVDFGTFIIPAQPGVLMACVDPFNAQEELNENDNCRELPVSQRQTNLSIASRDIRFTPAGVDVGEKVTISAIVRNRSSNEATTVVEWWHGRPSFPEGKLIGQSLPLVVSGSSSAETSFEWVREEGPIEVFARLTRVAADDSGGTINNVAGRHLFLESIVDLGTAGVTSTQGVILRTGRLTGAPAPELVIAYRHLPFPTGTQGFGLALLQPANGTYDRLWTKSLQDVPQDVVLADLDGDGTGEIVLHEAPLSSSNLSLRVVAYRPTGETKWERTVSTRGFCTGQSGRQAMAVGDINGDGTADIVVQEADVHAFSGVDGSPLFRTPIEPSNPNGGPAACGESNATYILDVDGDGGRDIIGVNRNQVFLLSSSGTVRWQKVAPAEFMSIVDLDLNGTPELLFPQFRAPLIALDATTGQTIQQGAPFESWDSSFAAGALRQDGLTYPVLGNNSNDQNVAAFSPDLNPLWNRWVSFFEHPAVTTLADLRGMGRPQVVAGSISGRPFILEGRSGETLVKQSPQRPNTGGSNTFGFDVSPLVADLTGTGTSKVVVGLKDSTGDHWNDSQVPEYGGGEALVFSSPHWKQMPTAWATRDLIQGHIGEDLKVSGNYQWWKNHNTWNQQFFESPSRLLPDLALLAGSLSSSPAQPTAGSQVALTAQLRNVGGLAASNVTVTFYDGDPASGGVKIGETVIAGPLAVRTGVSPATINWIAYPEGLHTLYAVANATGSVEESGSENNTASMTLFVGAGAQMCDLAIVPASLGATPAVPSAGTMVALAASITNAGGTSCAASQLSVYDGVPGANAMAAGAVAIPSLAPGQTAPLSVPVRVQSGNTLFRFIADEGLAALDADRSNNEAVFSLFVPPSNLPDLWVSTFSLTPNPAFIGESVEVTATVQNGGAPSIGSTFSVTLAGGALVAGKIPPLLAGESAVVNALVTAPAADGTLVFNADSPNSLQEYDESNNSKSAVLRVAPSAVALSGTASPSAPGPSTQVSVTFSLANSGSTGRTLTLDAQLLSPSGQAVSSLISDAPVVVAGQASVQRGATWNTGGEAPGVYRAVATVTEGGRLVAKAEVPITVVGEQSLQLFVASDRGSYKPKDTALLTQSVRNQSRNAPLANASLVLTVLDSGATVLHSSIRPLPSVPPGGRFDASDLFAVSEHLALGQYVVRSRLLDGTGAQLSQAQAQWEVSYQPADVLEATVNAANPFNIGPSLVVAATLKNGGTLNLAGGLAAELWNAETLAVESRAELSVDVAANAIRNVTLNVPTAGLQTGQKLLVLKLDEKLVARMLLSANASSDTTPPALSVTGVSDGQLANVDLTPVISIVDESTFQSTVTLDGQPFASGSAVSAEGQHTLSIQAVDAFDNASTLTLRFTIDKTPPVLTLAGVSDGASVNGPVTLTFSSQDAHPGTTQSTLDGVAIQSGTEVSAEGAHVWVVESTDAAGNRSTQTVRFTIDLTSPQIQVSGISAGAHSRVPVTITFGVMGSPSAAVTATLDGASFASGQTVSSEGAHLLVVSAVDEAGNTSTLDVPFTLDFTAPQIQLAGVTAGQLANGPLTPVFSASDAHLLQTVATLDGAPFASGTAVTAEGAHILVVRAADVAGNVAEVNTPFELDFTAPALQVSGVANGEHRNAPVVVTFGATDRNLNGATATLDGAAFTSGGTVSAAGQHLLRVTATDRAGNVSTREVTFTLDFTAPQIQLTGVAAGQLSNQPLTPVFSATDAHLSQAAATLDGTAFVSGTPVTAEGPHVLVVRATDVAGNVAEVNVPFELDFTAPALQVSGVANGEHRNAPVVITFGATDRNLNGVTATLDGAAFASGATVSAAGQHLLRVTATDRAGNVATRDVTFTLDFTLPVITVTGVRDGDSGESFTPTFSVAEANLATLTATLDGTPFTSGTTIGPAQAGPHTLVIVARDKAGNTATVTIRFTVQGVLPAFHFAACAEQGITIQGNAKVAGIGQAKGSIASNGPLTVANAAQITGDAVISGNAVLRNTAKLTGKLYYGGTLTLQNAASVGSSQKVTPAPRPCECGYDLAFSLTFASNNNDNSKLTSHPVIGPFFKAGVLSVPNAKLELPSGRYYLKSLSLTGTARLSVVPGGSAQLFIQGAVSVANTAALGVPSTSSARLLVVGGADSSLGQSIDIRNATDASLQLYAPKANITLGNTTTVLGSVVGRTITLNNSQKLFMSPGPQVSPPPLTCP